MQAEALSMGLATPSTGILTLLLMMKTMKMMIMVMMVMMMDMMIMMIHGISCAFVRDLNIVDRLLWLLVVLAFLGIAASLSWDLWSQWENDQVIKLV